METADVDVMEIDETYGFDYRWCFCLTRPTTTGGMCVKPPEKMDSFQQITSRKLKANVFQFRFASRSPSKISGASSALGWSKKPFQLGSRSRRPKLQV